MEVRDGDQVVEVAGTRLRALLIRLALDPGRPVGVNALADALWGDTPPTDTANAVQSLVSRLRRAVPGLGVLSGPAGYRLDLGPDDVDVKRFERLTRAGQEALRGGDAGPALATLREALALWRGPALVDVADAAYAIAAAGRLNELRLTAQEGRIEAELRLGHPAQLVAELDELTAAHPLRERLAALHMRALAAAGRPAEALTAYERIRQRLADELGVDPSPELRAAHLALLRGEAAPPPAEATAAPRGNLRAALTTFVGRDEDLRQLTKQLAENRLVTLVGPGGAGKTRLASAAAGILSDGIAGGAWLVELASITDPADVPRAVLDTLGRRDRALEAARLTPRDTMGRLVDALFADETLIVLDNCEHVIDAAAQLADELLGRCPGLRILATSREPLGILGEALDPVPPLRLPPADVTPVEALAYPSVQLLRDRAVAVRPGFAVTDGNVGDVVEICRRLDGLPLAIELAAARLRTLSPRQVAAGLDDRFRLLTGGSRTALPRHRTLRAVVDWSWGLLTDGERRLTERLAVFPSSVTADSAAGTAGSDAAALLDALVDKSLLQIVGDGRFRMLETIREYGLERLAEVGGVAAARAAHAAYFLHLVQTADPHLRTAGQLPWLRLLEAERDNIVGALHFACDAGDADTALRIGAALALPLAIWGDGLGGDVLVRALALPGPAPLGERAVVLAIGMITEALGAAVMPEAAQVAELASAIRAAQGSTNPYVPLLEPALAVFTDDTSGGIAAVDRARGHADPWTDGTLLAMRGQIRENDGDAEGMLRDLTQATKELRVVGERWSLSAALATYADALIKRGDFEAATAALEESARLSRELNPAQEPGFQVILLATMRARSGDVAGAKESLRRFVADQVTDRAVQDAAFGLMMLGDMARLEGSLDEARECFAEATRRLEGVPMLAPQVRGLLLAGMAHLALALGDAATARQRVSEAVDCGVAAHDMPVVAVVTVGWVAIAAAEGRFELAAQLLGTSDSLRGRPDRSNIDAQRLTEQLRAELGDEAYAASYARGYGLSRADALALVGTDPVR
ncbi:BTAD domain-containing putative transcriptional regulator [Micromonospora sp. NPDC048999]|uniref:BTAD domain-containing putative transcriptional regulator n=1 Tax=Micromonospora sp. NPDC048999 TaxID=3155391 RepID=UPI0033CFB92E